MKRLTLAVLFTVLSYHEILAQDVWDLAPLFVYGAAYNNGYGYGFGGASTPESAWGHAQADIVRSQGLYNESTAAAAVNFEEANSKHIENLRQWTQLNLYRKRALEEQRMAALNKARARNARYLEYVETHAGADLPARLTSTQLDRSTGKIDWPSALMRDSFAERRSEIEALFAKQARMGWTSDLASKITSETRALHQQLRSQIRQIVTQEYIDAYKFLSSLSLEGRFPYG